MNTKDMPNYRFCPSSTKTYTLSGDISVIAQVTWTIHYKTGPDPVHSAAFSCKIYRKIRTWLGDPFSFSRFFFLVVTPLDFSSQLWREFQNSHTCDPASFWDLAFFLLIMDNDLISSSLLTFHCVIAIVVSFCDTELWISFWT